MIDYNPCKGRWLVAHVPRDETPVGHTGKEDPQLVGRAHRGDCHSVRPKAAKKQGVDVPKLHDTWNRRQLRVSTAFLATIYSGSLEHTTIGDDDLLDWFVISTRLRGLDCLDDVHPVKNAAEDNVLAVEPGGVSHREEELRTVGVWSGVGHGEAPDKVLDLKVLVGELGTIDGLAASAIVVREITTLDHELGNDAVERGALVAETHLAGAKLLEVLRSLRDNRTKEAHSDPAEGLPADGDVEEDLVRNWGVHWGFFCFPAGIQFEIVCDSLQAVVYSMPLANSFGTQGVSKHPHKVCIPLVSLSCFN